MARFEAKLRLSVNAEDQVDAERGVQDIMGVLLRQVSTGTERWPSVTNATIEQDESGVELVDEED